MVDVSVVIPAWNTESTIREALESVCSQKTSHTYEVIVVDSGSDRTSEIVREFPGVKLIKPGKRTYSGLARNIGISETRGRIILFMDSDVIVEPNWINKVVEWHQRDECAVVAGAVLNGNPESLVGWASYITEFSEYMPYGSARYRLTGVTANFSAKRWVFDKYGGFNPNLKQYVDTEFNCRLNAGGDQLLFVPSILAKHKHRTTLREYLKHEIGRGRSAAAVRRHGYLPYNCLTRFRWLCMLAGGPVFIRTVYTTVSRFLKARMLPFWQNLIVIPISIVGSMLWTYGFLSESVYPRIHLVNPEGDQPTPVAVVQSGTGGSDIG